MRVFFGVILCNSGADEEKGSRAPFTYYDHKTGRFLP